MSPSEPTTSAPDLALLDVLERAGAARCLLLTDPPSGLRAVLVLDDLTLGPGCGGIRTRAYPSLAEAARDAAALARAMTVKNALAGLDAGGAKCVVLDHPGLDRRAAFVRLGELVQSLGGLFRTAGDLGTTLEDLEAMATTCAYVHTEEQDLAAAVARGLVRCMEACRLVRGEEDSVEGLRIAVQGAGSIGAAVVRDLVELGAEVLVADTDQARAETLAAETGAEVVHPGGVLFAGVDIVAPCAVGGVINPGAVRMLRAWAVCGAANNILASPEVAHELSRREIMYVPDTIASAGAVIDGIGRTVMGLEDRGPLIDKLGETAREVLSEAARAGRTTIELAHERAWARIGAAREALQ